MENFRKTVLGNGVRVVTEKIDHVGSAAIGIWCRTGSVHETSTEGGITHLIEHMLFKGTSRRDAKQIAEEIEGRGGMLNAFTDKEQTCYYCRVLADDVAVGLDVLSDMVTGSKIDSEELDREKGVVLEEIKRGEDEPGDLVHDLHMQRLWPGHVLGLPVIGTKESVSSFGRDDLKNYLQRRYTGGHLLVSVTGKIDHEMVVSEVEKGLGAITAGVSQSQFPAPTVAVGENFISKEVEQVHFCIGGAGLSQYDEDIYAVKVLDDVLGGGMSSRLFQEVREKRGLAYSVGSYHVGYSCGGAFTIYGGTGIKTWPEVRAVVNRELEDLATNGPTEAELAKVKRLICGGLILGLEGTNARMMRLARNELVHGRPIPIEEARQKIEAVSAADVKRLAQKLLSPSSMLTTAIGPFEAA